MAWVDGSSHAGIHELAVHTNGLQQTFIFWVNEVFLQFLDRFVYLLCELRVVDDLTDARAYVDENHHYAMALQFDGRFIFWLQESWGGKETLCVLEYLQGTLCIFLLASGKSVFRHGDGCKCLGEYVATLA